MSGTFVDNLDKADGALHAGDVRYVLVRADGLMGCFKSSLGSTPLAMYQEIEDSFFRFGGKSTQQYAETLGEDPEELLSKIEEIAPQLGWGKWALSLEPNQQRLNLTVENSPFSALLQNMVNNILDDEMSSFMTKDVELKKINKRNRKKSKQVLQMLDHRMLKCHEIGK